MTVQRAPLPPHERLTLAEYRQRLVQARREHQGHLPPPRHAMRLATSLRARLAARGIRLGTESKHDWESLAAEVEEDLAGPVLHVEAQAVDDTYDEEAIELAIEDLWARCQREGVAPAHRPVVVVHPPTQARPTALYTIDMPTRRLA